MPCYICPRRIGKKDWAHITRALRFIGLASLILLPSFSFVSSLRAATGDLDPTFGASGKVSVPTLGLANAAAIAVQPDGKTIVVGGRNTTGVNTDFAIVRLNQDGSFDNSFGTEGIVVTDFTGSFDGASAVALQPDGKIVVAGSTFRSFDLNQEFALARYNVDGSIDTTFGMGGKVSTGFFVGSLNGKDEARGVVVQSDGKIVAVGHASDTRTQDFLALVRYNSDGSLDTSFGSGGKVLDNTFEDSIKKVILQSDGKIVVGGTGSGTPDFRIARYRADGLLDSSFGSGGLVTTDFFGANDRVEALALQSDGKIVAAGSAVAPGSRLADFALARYESDGRLDMTFGSGGKVTTNFTPRDIISAIAIEPGGKIVALGGTSEDGNVVTFALTRYNTNGSLDSTFGTGGKVVTDLSSIPLDPSDVELEADGKIVVVWPDRNAILLPQFSVARYDGGRFDVCLEDNKNGNQLQINSRTGEYIFTSCSAALVIEGSGTLSSSGCVFKLKDNQTDRNVNAKFNTCKNTAKVTIDGTASGGSLKIKDKNTLNNSCSCL